MSVRQCLRWHCMCGYIMKIYHSTAVCIVEFTGRDTTSSTGIGAGGMGITNGNRKGMEIKLC